MSIRRVVACAAVGSFGAVCLGQEVGFPEGLNPASPSAAALRGEAGTDGSIFVDDTAAPGGDGTSWALAYRDLQNALADAEADPGVTRIHVAEGTYKADLGTGITTAAFVLRNGLEVLGGYPDGGGDRDPSVHVSLLSGDLGGNDPVTVTDNTRNLVVGSGTNGTAVLDGFTVRGGNSPIVGGGGLFVANGSPTIRGVSFELCQTGGSGGAVFVFDSIGVVTLIDCTVRSSSAKAGGGGLYAENSSVSLVGCSFEQNVAGTGLTSTGLEGLGGAVYVVGGGLSVQGGQFTQNRALRSGAPRGGALYALNVPILFLSGTRFAANETRTSTVIDGSGGAVYTDECGVDIDACEFAFNLSELGGGLHVDTVGTPQRLEITGTLFDRNQATSDGGGATLSTIGWSIKDCAFVGNIASGRGAGLYAPVTLEIGGSRFEGNVGGGEGAGAWLDQATIMDGEFVDNRGLRGGGVFLANLATVERTVFSGNEATQQGGGTAYASTSTFQDCTWRGNSASILGGGAYATSSNIGLFERCVFEANSAPSGGGLSASSASTSNGITVRNCEFWRNVADANGGAIWGFARVTAPQEVSGTLFVGNSAARAGAASSVGGTFANCTFYANEAGLIGGVEGIAGTRVDNCILWGNRDDFSGSGSEAAQLSLLTPTVSSSIIEGLQLYAGANNQGVDPGFRDPVGPDGVPVSGDENFRVADDSPAIDAGNVGRVPAGLLRDLDGNPRIVAFGAPPDSVDLGPYEVQDCDGNGVNDQTDIETGAVTDCNGNLVPDACESGDCNGNGQPDVCDIALGVEPDCNLNGVPDSCELGQEGFEFIGQTQAPFDSANEATWTILALQTPLSAASLTVQASGDFSSSSEFAEVFLNGTLLTPIFSTGVDCASMSTVVTITRSTMRAAILDNDGVLELLIRPNANVGACSNSFVSIALEFDAATITDCDGDGVLDPCQIFADQALDKDENGVLDLCELPCPADLNLDGALNTDDIELFTIGFVASLTLADLNADGAFNVDDIQAFLESFMAGCP